MPILHPCTCKLSLVSRVQCASRVSFFPPLHLVCPSLGIVRLKFFLNSKQNHNDEFILIYTTNRQFFLFHILLTIFSKSMSHTYSGDSIAIFIRYDRVVSPMRFRSRVFIIFICEKLHSIARSSTNRNRQTNISQNINSGCVNCYG